jgi:cytoskeleton protein RodZ
MSETSNQIEMPLEIGQTLRQAREKASLSLQDVADHLRVSSQIIDRIEKDQIEPSALSVFVRGYIRLYAKYVKVSLEQVDQYFCQLGVIDAKSSVKPTSFNYTDTGKKSKKLRFATIGIVLVLAVIVIVWSAVQRGHNQVHVGPVVVKPAVTVQTLGHPSATLSQTNQK